MSLQKKSLNLLMGVVLIMVGCKSNDPEVNYKEPQMRSFGFYAADNPGIIAKDYVIDSVVSTSIVLNMPADIDKENLIARFTTNEGDSVTVNGVGQRSGISVNNYTYPVDYYLSNGTLNARYSVSIGKAIDYVWTKLPAFTSDSMISAVMKVNPTDGMPYVLYKCSRTESTEQKIAMAHYTANGWVSMGAASDGQVGSYYDLTFSSTGVPYISFADYTASVSQMLTSAKYNGAGWEKVGSKGFTTSKVSYNSLAFNPDGQLMSFAMIDAAGGALARRELCISSFDGTSWTTNQTMRGRSSSMVAYMPVARFVNGALYVAVFNAINPNSFSVYRLKDGLWTTLLDKWKAETATSMNIRDFDMDVDYSGNVYIALVDNSTDGSSMKYKILKYSVADGSVGVLGNPFMTISGGEFNYSLAVSPTGVPYLLYRNASLYPVVSYFDEETQEWSVPYLFELNIADNLCIDFSSNGDGYASYTKNRRIVVYKFSEPN